jgi:hypothetical protein
MKAVRTQAKPDTPDEVNDDDLRKLEAQWSESSADTASHARGQRWNSIIRIEATEPIVSGVDASPVSLIGEKITEVAGQLRRLSPRTETLVMRSCATPVREIGDDQLRIRLHCLVR